jgi:hypothetical protein
MNRDRLQNNLFERWHPLGMAPLVAGLVLTIGSAAMAGGAWTATGSMARAQRDQPITLLDNGKVLVGQELYDPVTGTFGPAGGGGTGVAFSHGSFATATRLSDGRVLIVGGTNSAPSTPALLYDPAIDTFSATGTPNAPRRRYAHSAIRLHDGRVLIAGGTDGFESTAIAELYDPATGAFTFTGSLNTGRADSAAALLRDGRVLIVGGSNRSTPEYCLSSAELYDPATGTFTPTGSITMPGCGYWFEAPVLADGTVLITGGFTVFGGAVSDSAELFDPLTDTFTATGRMTTPRAGHSVTLLCDGQVLLAGGLKGPGPVTIDTAEIYDPASGTFTPTANMTVARQQHMATRLPNGQVLVAGGFDGSDDVSSAELFSRPTHARRGGESVTGSRPRCTRSHSPRS